MSLDPDRKVRGSEFLEREVYRQRRLLDALKLLPVLGAILFLVPALVFSASAASIGASLIYFFAIWFFLIVICALLSRRRAQSEG